MPNIPDDIKPAFDSIFKNMLRTFGLREGVLNISIADILNSTAVGLLYADTIPVSGAHSQGDILFNRNPIAGGSIGWVCVTAGTPGTWKEWGLISL